MAYFSSRSTFRERNLTTLTVNFAVQFSNENVFDPQRLAFDTESATDK